MAKMARSKACQKRQRDTSGSLVEDLSHRQISKAEIVLASLSDKSAIATRRHDRSQIGRFSNNLVMHIFYPS